MKKWLIICFLVIIQGLSLQVAAAKSRPVVTLMTHDSFAVSKDLLKTFEEKHGVTLKILKGGDAGAALNQAILSKGNPLADVFYGVDNGIQFLHLLRIPHQFIISKITRITLS